MSDREYKFHNIKDHPNEKDFKKFQWVDMKDGKHLSNSKNV